MLSSNEIVIIKLGGSIITDKNIPFSFRKDVVENLLNEIAIYYHLKKNRIILIHGGGSFGHPLAKQYRIQEGFNSSIPNQLYGLAQTHHAMTQLNTKIIEGLFKHEVPAINIQTSSIYRKVSKTSQIIGSGYSTISSFLDLNIVPILHGDVLFDDNNSFSIISGDKIIEDLCFKLKGYRIQKVIFVIEKDGILISTGNSLSEISLVSKIQSNQLNLLNLAKLEEKIDVTGGIRKKLYESQKICQNHIPVQIINGLIGQNLFRALENQETLSTIIIP